MKSYFREFAKGVNNAHKVEQATHKLFDALSAATPTLTDTAPTGSFKVAITLATVAAAGTNPAHTDVTGDVYVNSEKISFSTATRKTTSTVLSALPAISTVGLDCHILAECITSSGAPIYKEVLTDIEILCFPKTRILRDESGSGWQQTDYRIFSEATLVIGDRIRFFDPPQNQNLDIYVKHVEAGVDIEDNTQQFRVYDCA